MNLHANTQKLKKAQAKNKSVYLLYDNYQEIHGTVNDLGNVFVHILSTKDNTQSLIPLEIEKIHQISLRAKSITPKGDNQHEDCQSQ
ncbi:hypothetical protein [Cysteiniphilum marinum]|uniref:hypothetical protein n=1 Tax=Cysteiniphilum marinum TaxID=2774191 RepID=UPI00193A9A9D|nr:hypothetical protein [Cysteiniphilum marinum]